MYLLFDIGGTNLRLAISRDGEHLADRKAFPTPRAYEDGITLVRAFAQSYRGERFSAAAGGIAGSFDRQAGMLRHAPHLPLWVGQPLREAFSDAIGSPVFFENDAALAGLGEAVLGAGKGYAIVAYVTVGTGTNGVRIVDGRIDRSAHGFEIGHQAIQVGGALCACGGSGHLEAYVSGAAFVKRYEQKPQDVQDATAWGGAADLLACGIANTIFHWSPDAVVLGGPMILGKPAIPFTRVADHIRNIVGVFSEPPQLRLASLGDEGGLRGALLTLNNQGTTR